MKRCRESGIEALRIMSMILIILGHSHFRIHLLPNAATIIKYPLSSFGDVMLSCVTTTGVGIFIAISGWFGIKLRKEGLAKYLFLVFFTLWSVYCITIALRLSDFNYNGIKVCLGFYEGYWFVAGYLGLYLISPILNSFIEHATKKELQITLLSYYIFQSYYSWISGWYNYYDGYCIIMFAGIYLTISYLRKYTIEWIEKKAPLLLLTTILLMTIISYLCLWKYGFAGRQIRVDNPLAIISAVLFVICFNKFKYHSRVVNLLASSCFAVYLIHYSPFVYPHLMSFMHSIYLRFNGLMYGIILVATLILIYLSCTLFDLLRIACWKILKKRIN